MSPRSFSRLRFARRLRPDCASVLDEQEREVVMPDAGMNPRLTAVLSRLCERLGPLFKTQAVKLPYLVDVVAGSVLGHAIADGTYQTWEHGVVAKEVYRFIQRAGAARAPGRARGAGQEPGRLHPSDARSVPSALEALGLPCPQRRRLAGQTLRVSLHLPDARDRPVDRSHRRGAGGADPSGCGDPQSRPRPPEGSHP